MVSTMQGGTTPIFNVFGMTGPSTNRESNPQILLMDPPYCRLLLSAGATEDLFGSIRSPHPGSPYCTLLGEPDSQDTPWISLLALLIIDIDIVID